MAKSEHVSSLFWSSRKRVARGAGSGSIFGGPSQGKSRVDSLETRISCCGARAANHQGTTRPAPRAARRRSSGAGSRWPTAPWQQFPRSTSRSPSRRPEGGSRETVSIPSRIPGLQSGPRPLPALAGLVPEPIMVGGLVGRPARREGRRAQPASPGLRQDVERRPVRHVRRRRCSPRNARPRRDPPALADAKFALNSAVVRGEPQEVARYGFGRERGPATAAARRSRH